MIVQGAVLGSFIVAMVAIAKWAFARQEEELEPMELFTPKEEEQPCKWVGNGIEIVSQPNFLEPPIYVDKDAKVEFYKLPASSMVVIYNLNSAVSITVSKSRIDANNALGLMLFLEEEKVIQEEKATNSNGI